MLLFEELKVVRVEAARKDEAERKLEEKELVSIKKFLAFGPVRVLPSVNSQEKWISNMPGLPETVPCLLGSCPAKLHRAQGS